MRVIFSPSMAARSFECGGVDRRQTLVPVDYEALSLSVVLERSHISDVTVVFLKEECHPYHLIWLQTAHTSKAPYLCGLSVC